jgi:Leucine-rich repeat (LRR) protein
MNMNADALDSYIEVKNEQMPTLKACALDSAFRKLTHLNLSMNKIAVVEGGFECSNLHSLILTDNLIKEIPPRLLAKCPKLQLLDLSLNHISRIQNLPTTLTELSLAQNRLTVIEGLS